MHPWQCFWYEFAQKGGCRARTAASSFAHIVDIVSIVLRHLGRVVLEERQTPDPIAGLTAGGVQQLPQTLIVGERTGNAIAEGNLFGFRCLAEPKPNEGNE